MHRLQPTTPILLAAAVGCGLATAPAHAQNFGPWVDTQPEYAINGPAADGCPIESQDGLTLWIASSRAGTLGKLDLFRAQRPSVESTWGPVENAGAVNSDEFDYCPTPLQGKWLLFVSARDTETDADPGNDDCLPGPPAPPPPGSPSAGDMYLVREHPVSGWTEPLNLGCFPDGPNTAGSEYSPSLVSTGSGTELYFSSNGYPDSQGHDIYVSQVLADGTVLAGTRVAELSSAAQDVMPNVRKDGLEIVFSSTRPGGAGQQDIYAATRESPALPWSAPQRIDNPAINTAASETRASLSGDGSRLHFGRKIDIADPGDVFVSTRARQRGQR